MTADSDERIGIDGEPPEGQNSASLVDGRIVVDPGPLTDTAWTDLRIGLERAGVSLERLERHTRGNDPAPAPRADRRRRTSRRRSGQLRTDRSRLLWFAASIASAIATSADTCRLTARRNP